MRKHVIVYLILVILWGAFPQVVGGAEAAREARVAFSHGEVTLAGTLTLPAGAGPHPAVVTITGSGPQDRDNSSAKFPGYQPFRELADALAGQGIAVLRYDDRSVGQSSGGDIQTAAKTELTNDALAAIDYLKGRSDIDPCCIGLLGHSEGGLIAGIVAAETSVPAFVIALAAPAVSGFESMRETLRLYVESGVIAAEVAELQNEATRLALAEQWPALQELLYRNNVKQFRAIAQKTHKPVENMDVLARTYAATSVAEYQNPRFAFQCGFDPAGVWSRVTVPVLALYAEFDYNVPAHLNQPALTAALEQAGNGDVTTAVLPDVNHLFVEAHEVEPNPAAWTRVSEHLAPDVVNLISAWLQERTSGLRCPARAFVRQEDA